METDAFIRIDCSPAEFGRRLAVSLPGRQERRRLMSLVTQLAVFTRTANRADYSSLPGDLREELRAARVADGAPAAAPDDAPARVGWDDPAEWYRLLVRAPWGTRLFIEGEAVRQYLAAAFATHARVEVRDPYFSSKYRKDRPGTLWLLGECIGNTAIRTLEVHCRPDSPDVEWFGRLLSQLKKAWRSHGGRRQDVLNVRVYSYGRPARFHDRSIVFRTWLQPAWSCAFFLGTGLTSMSNGYRRPTIVGRTTYVVAAQVTDGNPLSIVDLSLDPQDEIVTISNEQGSMANISRYALQEA